MFNLFYANKHLYEKILAKKENKKTGFESEFLFNTTTPEEELKNIKEKFNMMTDLIHKTVKQSIDIAKTKERVDYLKGFYAGYLKACNHLNLMSLDLVNVLIKENEEYAKLKIEQLKKR